MHQEIPISVSRLAGRLLTLVLLTVTAPVLANDDIVIDFGTGLGLYARMNDASWLRLNPASPTQVVTGDVDGNGEDDVIAAFDFGIFIKYNLGPWQLLHKTTPETMSVGDLDNNGQDDVVIDFGTGAGLGLYARMNDTSWLRLNPASPTQVVTGDVDGNGEDDVIAAFDFGTFVKYNQGPWQRLHKSTAEAMAVGDLDSNGQDDVVIDFGAGLGLYARMNDTSWLRLYNGSPDLIATGDIDGNGADDVVATFGSSFGGSWVNLNLGGWSRLSTLAADDIVTGNVNGTGSDDIVASFATSIGGVYVKRDQGPWSLLNNSNPHSIAVGNLDGSPTFIGDVAIMSELLDSAQGGGVGAWGTDSDSLQVLPQFEYEKISYDIATDTLIFEDAVYDYATQTFVPFTKDSDDLWLKADGSWIPVSQTVTAVLAADNGDGSMTVSIRDSSDDGELARFRVSARTIDISGEAMVNHLDADWTAVMIDPTAVFGAGAQQVSSFTTEALVDAYEMDVDTSCEINEPARFALLNGNCNGVLVMATNIFSTTLDQLISTDDWVDLDDGSETGLVAVFASFNASNSTVLMAELVNSGNTVNYYVRDFSINVTDEDRVRLVLSDLGGWVRDTSIYNTDMIRFTVPVSLAAQFPDLSANEIDRRHNYVVHNGFVRDGFLELVGDIETDEDLSYNGIAIDLVLANFSSPAATFDCNYESGWDDLADGGLGAPINPNSFADYEGVIASCGTALPLSVADVKGLVFTADGEATAFNDTAAAGTVSDPGTGVFYGTGGLMVDFEWYLEAATCTGCTHDYLVSYSADSIDADLPFGYWFRETTAVTAVLGTPGATGTAYTSHNYSEASNYSDTDRATGADGEIWNTTKFLGSLSFPLTLSGDHTDIFGTSFTANPGLTFPPQGTNPDSIQWNQQFPNFTAMGIAVLLLNNQISSVSFTWENGSGSGPNSSTYGIACPGNPGPFVLGDCSQMSIDMTARQMTFDVTLEPFGPTPPNGATAPITLQGVLGY